MNGKIPLKREGVLDAAIYRLRIDDIEQKTSQAGNPYLNVKFAVIVRGQPYGGAIWDVVSLTPQSRFVVEAFLDSVGAPNSDDEVSPQWFKGKFCWAMLKTGEWKGKLRNEVDYYVVSDPQEAKAVADDGKYAAEDDETFEDAAPKKAATRSAPVGSTRGSKAKAAPVAEMEEEDFPL